MYIYICICVHVHLWRAHRTPTRKESEGHRVQLDRAGQCILGGTGSRHGRSGRPSGARCLLGEETQLPPHVAQGAKMSRRFFIGLIRVLLPSGQGRSEVRSPLIKPTEHGFENQIKNWDNKIKSSEKQQLLIVTGFGFQDVLGGTHPTCSVDPSF